MYPIYISRKDQGPEVFSSTHKVEGAAAWQAAYFPTPIPNCRCTCQACSVLTLTCDTTVVVTCFVL